jgi:hypothetical protein
MKKHLKDLAKICQQEEIKQKLEFLASTEGKVEFQ